MKTKAMFLMTGLLMVSMVAFAAGKKTEKFKVSGNCGMCETRIEKAAKSVDGVLSADWDQKTKELKVSFDEAKTSKPAIQKAIAKVGHDTGDFKSDDAVYNALPGCCKYRK